MLKPRVLFVCIHNSARSQMAEAWLKVASVGRFDVQSAGLEPGILNPLVVQAMMEVGIDISQKTPQAVADLFKRGERFDYVIAVCDAEAAEKCPLFPGVIKRLHWSFPDPSKVVGTKEEKLIQIRIIRDAIKQKIETWCAEIFIAD